MVRNYNKKGNKAMSKLYIIQLYNTTEEDLYNVDPSNIENVITDNEEEAKKIESYIDEYNENMTGRNGFINSSVHVVTIDLGNTVIDSSVKFDTLESVKESHLFNEEDYDE